LTDISGREEAAEAAESRSVYGIGQAYRFAKFVSLVISNIVKKGEITQMYNIFIIYLLCTYSVSALVPWF
jgi:hypothetical protein